MKRKTGHIVLTLVCLLTVCQIFVFTGCGTQSKTPTETSLLVEQGGKITSTIVESFDKEYYTQESLREMIESEIAAYKGADAAVTIDSLDETDDTDTAGTGRKVAVVMSYASPGDYAAFNDIRFFYGTVSEAQADGYAIPADLVSVKDENKTITSQELDDMKEYHVLITEESIPVYLPEKPVYMTKGMLLADSQCIRAGEESLGLTYVIMK